MPWLGVLYYTAMALWSAVIFLVNFDFATDPTYYDGVSSILAVATMGCYPLAALFVNLLLQV